MHHSDLCREIHTVDCPARKILALAQLAVQLSSEADDMHNKWAYKTFKEVAPKILKFCENKG